MRPSMLYLLPLLASGVHAVVLSYAACANVDFWYCNSVCALPFQLHNSTQPPHTTIPARELGIPSALPEIS
ncbi:hypothetical protein N657DRAFT_247383 [Parathielavia appendiculata]|uniref:Secreted protein n=1 Tax=Parathielavia appendiculata TaxID=2587402 RepID=A0AAN6TTH1_9PEZI|nr:hypothetical protein N657DRAFT_247383 [Parathielavia appendiculata]